MKSLTTLKLLLLSITSVSLAISPNSSNAFSLEDAKQQIKDKEYEIRWQEKAKAYQSPNRAQNMRISYFSDGFKAELRDKRAYDHDWSLSVAIDSYNKGAQSGKTNFKKFDFNGKAAFAHHNNLTIDYSNTPNGLRQNFLIHTAPRGNELLEVKLSVSSESLLHEVTKEGDSIEFYSELNGDRVATYSDLNVFDANGKRLQAQFIADMENNISIVVDDSNAVYPVLVDPITETDSVTGSSSDQFGYALAYVNGANGGVFVGAPFYDGGQTNEGTVYYYDRDTGSTLHSSYTWSYEPNESYSYFGCSISVGNFDNHDTAVVIGAYGYDDAYTYTEGGAIFLFGGTLDSANNEYDFDTSYDWSFTGESDYANLGYSLSEGFANSGGLADLLVGAPRAGDSYYTESGKIYLFLGGNTSAGLGSADWSYLETIDNVQLGTSVALVNLRSSSGYADIVAGAPNYYSNTGQVRIWEGEMDGIPNSSTPDVTLYGDNSYDSFGKVVADAGRVYNANNKSSIHSLAVGAPGAEDGETNEGLVYIWYGADGDPFTSTSPDVTLQEDQSYASFGSAISRGRPDNTYWFLAVGAPLWDYDDGMTTLSNAGAVFHYHGSSTGVDTTNDDVEYGDSANDKFGSAIADYDWGGSNDGIIVGAPGAGKIYVLEEN